MQVSNMISQKIYRDTFGALMTRQTATPAWIAATCSHIVSTDLKQRRPKIKRRFLENAIANVPRKMKKNLSQVRFVSKFINVK